MNNGLYEGLYDGGDGGDWGPAREPTPSPAGRRRTGWRRLVPTWRLVVGTVLLFVLGISGAMVAGYLLVDIPAPNKAAASQNNVYLYADGSQLARDGDVNRQNVSLSKIPKNTQHAILAAEDRNFYNESAVNLKAMTRAGWKMVTGGGRQSGSTITQQYVKNYYLTQDQTLTRKAKEFFIAIKLDREVSKSEILEGYLNTSYFGRNAYGVEAAAQAYYGKKALDLTIPESAYLAALLNSPSTYDTRTHPDKKDQALSRWNYVLDGMVEEGWLTESKRKGMEFPDPDPVKPSTGLSGQRGYLVEAVNDYLTSNEIISEQRLKSGGFRITTTIEPERQKAMVNAVDEQLMSQLSKDREVDSFVRAGGTSIDPQTGDVVAMYGGVDYVEHYVNSATRRDFQVGSTFKPFVYASAVENDSTTQDGRPINARTVYDGTNKREVVSDGRGTGYSPANEDDVSYGQIPVTTAMDKSVNAVFAQMGVDVGPRKVKETAVALGLPEETPNMPADGSISLGVATASTLDMAEAYATLAEHGKHRDPHLVKKATRGGEVVKLPDRKPDDGVARESADSTTAILQSVVEGGTGTAAQSAGRPAAGKTGTAEEDRAAWFAGYTPELATVVAVMGQNPEGGQEPLYGAAGLPRINGGGFPAQIWGAYTAEALQGEPVREFDLEADTGDAPLPTGPPTSRTPESEPPPQETPSSPPVTEEPPTSPGTPSTPTGPSTTIPTTPQTPPGPDGGAQGGAEGADTEGTLGGTPLGNTRRE